MRRFLGVILSLLLFVPNLLAQNSNDYRRVGLNLHGGLTLPDNGGGGQLLGSNFSGTTSTTYNFGAGLSYDITPMWTIYGGYRYNEIEGTGNSPFTTDIHSASLKATINFNRLFRRSTLSNFLNPYGIIGAEQDFYSFSSNTESFSSNPSSVVAGAGIAFRISDMFDLFSQYEVKFSTNSLDNQTGGVPFDQIGMLSAGIKINFGKKGSKPLRMYPPVKRLSDLEYQEFKDKVGDIDRATEGVARQERALRDMADRFALDISRRDSIINDLSDELARAHTRIDDLEERVSRLENRIDSIKIGGDLSVRLKTVASGHYVQVFAARDLESSVRVRDDMQRQLGGRLPDGICVFMIHRNGFYEVLIGTFEEYQAASEINNRAVQTFDDSFIITFPRPTHLLEVYNDTHIIE